jgi:hypothetical protein
MEREGDKMKTINFSDLSEEEKQACVDFIYKGWRRHMDDIEQMETDLKEIKEQYGLVPKNIELTKWITIKDLKERGTP